MYLFATVSAYGYLSDISTKYQVRAVELNLITWRKVNCIHNWFVLKNVQNGVDDCNRYLVTKSNLEALQKVVKQVLDDNSLAMELLPPSKGFFFGSQELDSYYFTDLQYTYDRITDVLNSYDNELLFFLLSYHPIVPAKL